MDTTTWDELPVYASDGSKITYQLTEDGDGDYSAKYKINYNGEVIKEGKGETLNCSIYDNESVKVTFINKLARKSRSSKTGDTTPILPYLTLFLASLAGIAFLLFRRRRTM